MTRPKLDLEKLKKWCPDARDRDSYLCDTGHEIYDDSIVISITDAHRLVALGELTEYANHKHDCDLGYAFADKEI